MTLHIKHIDKDIFYHHDKASTYGRKSVPLGKTFVHLEVCFISDFSLLHKQTLRKGSKTCCLFRT